MLHYSEDLDRESQLIKFKLITCKNIINKSENIELISN